MSPEFQQQTDALYAQRLEIETRLQAADDNSFAQGPSRTLQDAEEEGSEEEWNRYQDAEEAVHAADDRAMEECNSEEESLADASDKKGKDDCAEAESDKETETETEAEDDGETPIRAQRAQHARASGNSNACSCCRR